MFEGEGQEVNGDLIGTFCIVNGACGNGFEEHAWI